MLIENLRVVDTNKLDTPTGPIAAPITYFMDIALNQEEVVAVPISGETFASLHNLATASEIPGPPDPSKPMGVPA
jgi:hypothetical protein